MNLFKLFKDNGYLAKTKKELEEKILAAEERQSAYCNNKINEYIHKNPDIPHLYRRLGKLDEDIENLLFLDKKVDEYRKLVYQYLFLLWLVAGLSIILAILVIKFIPMP